jgi:hypothetical protein
LPGQYDWQQVTFQNGHISVMMPGQPVDVPVRQQPNPMGLDVETALKMVKFDDGSSCMAAYNDVPSWAMEELKRTMGEEALVQGTLEGFAHGCGGEVTAQQSISLDGYPGLEFTLRFPADSLFGHGRLYQLDTARVIVTWTTSGETPSAEVRAFLDTVRIH